VSSLNNGRFRRQISFLRQQFLQDGESVFANVLSDSCLVEALRTNEVEWRDRVFSPMVTLWVFLIQVLSADHSCRAAVARLVAHRVSQGRPPCSAETSAYCLVAVTALKTQDVSTWTASKLVTIRNSAAVSISPPASVG